jgi:hypothetical protein
MREVRLSIPVIGGITVVYTGEEIHAKKEAVKRHVSMGIAHVSRFASGLISKLANKIENKPTDFKPAVVEETDACPACGGPRKDGVCPRHGKR